jgi:pimeloyl-ACP methyl ester carboxylesterase
MNNMDKKIKIDDIDLNYRVYGDNQMLPNVVVLHGWGTNLNVMESISKKLSQNFTVFSLDLPGFGKTNEPVYPWGIYEYADFVENAMKALKIESPILIGHSFGGRISIILSSRMKVSKLVLVDAAGIKPKRTAKYYVSVYTYKIIKNISKLPGLKFLFFKFVEDYRKGAGSADYKSASDMMKGVLVKVVNEDLKKHLSNIKAETLLIWGENDLDTPVSDARIMDKTIKNSELVIIKNAGHFSFLEQQNQFLIILNHFLLKD